MTDIESERCGVDFQCHCFDPRAWQIAAEEGWEIRLPTTRNDETEVAQSE